LFGEVKDTSCDLYGFMGFVEFGILAQQVVHFPITIEGTSNSEVAMHLLYDFYHGLLQFFFHSLICYVLYH
jgi:hypothetical protein